MSKFFNSNPKYLSKTSSMPTFRLLCCSLLQGNNAKVLQFQPKILIRNFINADVSATNVGIDETFDKYFGLELKNFGMNYAVWFSLIEVLLSQFFFRYGRDGATGQVGQVST